MQNNNTHNNAPTQLDFYDAIRSIIQNARNRVSRTINTAMVETYWQIGRHIVEEEQRGEDRAEYGQFLIKNLAVRLTNEFGKGFDGRNLRNMRAFYIAFPKWNAVSTKLSWTHYRALIPQSTYAGSNSTKPDGKVY